jgi:hypothetical protein
MRMLVFPGNILTNMEASSKYVTTHSWVNVSGPVKHELREVSDIPWLGLYTRPITLSTFMTMQFIYVLDRHPNRMLSTAAIDRRFWFFLERKK